MTIAYSYSRFSSKKQALGDSLRRQVEASKKYAAEQGWKLDESLTPDLGVSAWKGKHRHKGALAGFLRLIETGAVKSGSFLIIEALDRLSRQEITEALALFLQIINKGIGIVTLVDGQKYTKEVVDNNQGIIFLAIGVLMGAHEYSDKLSYRVRAAKAKSLSDLKLGKRGVFINGKPPFWIVKENGRWVLDAKKSATVRQMIEWAMDGVGMLGIANRLTKLGIRTHSNKVTWNDTTIYKMLHSPTLVGTIELRNHDPIKNYYPALLTEKEWYVLQGILNARKQTIHGRHGEMTNIFGNILTLGNTGNRMGIVKHSYADKTRKNFINLACIEGMKGRGDPCSIAYAPVENAFLEFITELNIDKKTAGKVHGVDQIELRAKQISEKQRRLSGLQTLLENEDLSQSLTIAKSIAKIEQEIAILKSANEEAAASMAVPTTSAKDVAELVEQLMSSIEKPRLATQLAVASDRGEIRRKIKMAIQQIVKKARIWVYGTTVKRVAIMAVELHTGEMRIIAIKTERGRAPQWNSDIGTLYGIQEYDWDKMGRDLLARTDLRFTPRPIRGGTLLRQNV